MEARRGHATCTCCGRRAVPEIQPSSRSHEELSTGSIDRQPTHCTPHRPHFSAYSVRWRRDPRYAVLFVGRILARSAGMEVLPALVQARVQMIHGALGDWGDFEGSEWWPMGAAWSAPQVAVIRNRSHGVRREFAVCLGIFTGTDSPPFSRGKTTLGQTRCFRNYGDLLLLRPRFYRSRWIRAASIKIDIKIEISEIRLKRVRFHKITRSLSRPFKSN